MKKRRLIAAAPGDDRRKQMIRLTPQGRRLVSRLKPVWVATHRAAIALEAELPARLNEVMDQAFLALDRIPFNRRIHNKLRK
jgi:DNA-binding MarR family transcriptional regulator